MKFSCFLQLIKCSSSSDIPLPFDCFPLLTLLRKFTARFYSKNLLCFLCGESVLFLEITVSSLSLLYTSVVCSACLTLASISCQYYVRITITFACYYYEYCAQIYDRYCSRRLSQSHITRSELQSFPLICQLSYI